MSVSLAGGAAPWSSIVSALQPSAALRSAVDPAASDGAVKEAPFLARVTSKAGLATSSLAMTLIIAAATRHGQRPGRGWRLCGGSGGRHEGKRVRGFIVANQAPPDVSFHPGVQIPSNLYELLGITLAAPSASIKHAYYDKMKLCHPDIAGPDGEQMCMLLNEAYRTLGSPQARAAYDEGIRRKPGEEGSAPLEEFFNDAADRTPMWNWSPQDAPTDEPPLWKGRPHSQPMWDTVPAEGRGARWHQEQFAFVDEWACIACYNCCDVAPETFNIDEESGRARVFAQWGNDEHYLDYAIAACPVDCIHWVGRDELTVLEHVTRVEMHACGGYLPCPMTARVEPRERDEGIFTKAARWRRRMEMKARHSARRGASLAAVSSAKLQERIREAYARLPSETRSQGWGERVG